MLEPDVPLERRPLDGGVAAARAVRVRVRALEGHGRARSVAPGRVLAELEAGREGKEAGLGLGTNQPN